MIEHHCEMKEVEQLTKLLITNAERDIRKAATIYGRLLDKYPGSIAEVKAAVPFAHWGRLQAVALGALDPRLFYDFSIGAAQLRQMPLSVQKSVLSDGVELLISDGGHLRVRLGDLTRDQAYQVFDTRNKCLRTEGQQRVYLEKVRVAKEEAARATSSTPDYEWVNGKLKLNVAMSPSDILKIIADGPK